MDRTCAMPILVHEPLVHHAAPANRIKDCTEETVNAREKESNAKQMKQQMYHSRWRQTRTECWVQPTQSITPATLWCLRYAVFREYLRIGHGTRLVGSARYAGGREVNRHQVKILNMNRRRGGEWVRARTRLFPV